MESRGEIAEDKSILVIPSCNPFSMNVSRRFWAMDGTDINRMFPGYDQGETTQRIAAAVFSHIEGFRYGMQMASFYVPGEFVPHVRMLRTGYEDVDSAKLFGLPYVAIREPLPFDTALLNYNWQIWNTKAYSIYAGQTDHLDSEGARSTIECILRFMYTTGIITYPPLKCGFASTVIDEKDLVTIKAQMAGIYKKMKTAGTIVAKGETLAQIIDPFNGFVIEEIKSPCYGEIFFAHDKPLVLQSATVFKIHTSV